MNRESTLQIPCKQALDIVLVLIMVVFTDILIVLRRLCCIVDIVRIITIFVDNTCAALTSVGMMICIMQMLLLDQQMNLSMMKLMHILLQFYCS